MNVILPDINSEDTTPKPQYCQLFLFLVGMRQQTNPSLLLQSESQLFLLHFCLTNLPLSYALLLPSDIGSLHLPLGVVATLVATLYFTCSHCLACFLLQAVSPLLLSRFCLTYLPISHAFLIPSHIGPSLLPLGSLAKSCLLCSLLLACFLLQLVSQLLLLCFCSTYLPISHALLIPSHIRPLLLTLSCLAMSCSPCLPHSLLLASFSS